ncbi:MAG: hypothetical protein M3R02_07355 [Chloroflexota bacterium]|nr:hypothetical protein [Chloroflexota bacterium]
MPTETPARTPAKPPKATWRDWLIADRVPPEEIARMEDEGLLTREELLAEVNDPAGWELVEDQTVKPVTPGDMQYWENTGVLPRSVRRWHQGATRALYPRWFVFLVRQIRYYQLSDTPLDEIAAMLRAYVRHRFSRHPADQDVREHADNLGLTPADLRLPQAVEFGLRRFAAWHQRITGVDIDRVEIAVVDKNGRRHVREVPIASRPSTRPEQRVSLSDHLDSLGGWGPQFPLESQTVCK